MIADHSTVVAEFKAMQAMAEQKKQERYEQQKKAALLQPLSPCAMARAERSGGTLHRPRPRRPVSDHLHRRHHAQSQSPGCQHAAWQLDQLLHPLR